MNAFITLRDIDDFKYRFYSRSWSAAELDAIAKWFRERVAEI